jgi:hypothetical protein
LKSTLQKGIAIAMLGGTCALSVPAHATLGGNVASIASDASAMHATSHTVTTQAAYAVHTLTLPTGTVVREYASTAGTVFGVAWNGPTLPDLKTTLGASFDAYVAANATRHANQGVSTDSLVVVSGGHLRAFAGHAYLPPSLPAGVDASVIQ